MIWKAGGECGSGRFPARGKRYGTLANLYARLAPVMNPAAPALGVKLLLIQKLKTPRNFFRFMLGREVKAKNEKNFQLGRKALAH